MTTPLGRRLLAETVGTGFLVAAVIGSGMAAQRLSPGDTGLQLLESALATGAVLAALILALGHVSASFNPVVSAVTYRRGDPVTGLLAVIAAQVTGAVAGAAVANLMFGQPAIVGA